MKEYYQRQQFSFLANQTGVAQEDKPTSHTQVNVDKFMPTSYPLRDKTLSFSISSYNPNQTPFVADNFWTVYQYEILPKHQLMVLEEERVNSITDVDSYIVHKKDGSDPERHVGDEMPFGFGDSVQKALAANENADSNKMGVTSRIRPIAHFYDVQFLHLNPNTTNGKL